MYFEMERLDMLVSLIADPRQAMGDKLRSHGARTGVAAQRLSRSVARGVVVCVVDETGEVAAGGRR